MTRVGIVGIGFMGWIHYLAYQQVKALTIAAIATRDPKKQAGDWRGIQGNFGPPGEQVDLAGIAVYSQLSELLADESIDLVDICLPPQLHKDAAIAALAAGKHVLCEKPLALTADECDAMVQAAEKHKRRLLVGHVLPYFPEYACALREMETGKYGRVLGGSFKRVISDPLWLHDFYDPHKVGGPLLDLHVHDAHLIRLLFGMPAAVTSTGRMRGEVVEFCQSLFHFDDPQLAVHAASGVINQQGRRFTHGFEVHLEKATLQYEFAWLKDGPETMPLKIITDDGEVQRPQLGAGDEVVAFAAELSDVAAAVESGTPSPVLAGNLARDAIVLCQRQHESVIKGCKLEIAG